MNAPIHISLDLETLDSKSTAAILSIGAAVIEPDLSTVRVLPSFYAQVSIEDAMKYGTVSPHTLHWWFQQPEQARKEIINNKTNTLAKALGDFTAWIRMIVNRYNYGEDTVQLYLWGNGADFDNAILSNAYQMLGEEQPWGFRSNMCYRTLKNLYPEIPKVTSAIPHHAMHDALAQAEHLRKLLIHKQNCETAYYDMMEK
jgi:exodeoxyribonuclease VIII